MPRGSAARRVLDKGVGVPLLAAAGLIRRRRAWSADIRRIVVLQAPMIGDTVLLTGPLHDLRRAFPAATITFLVGCENAGIAPLMPKGIAVARASYTSPAKTTRAIRALRPDVVIDFGTWPRISALFSLFSGARFTAGFRTAGQHRHYAYDVSVDHSAACHELANQRALTAAVIGQAATSEPALSFSLQSLPAGLRPGGYAVLHGWASGAGKRLKEWDPAHWATVAAWLSQRGLAIVITGAPQDADDAADLAGTIARATDTNVIDVAGKVALGELPSLLAQAAVVVSVNTGIMHMAAATAVPVVGLHGPTSAARWGPHGKQCRAVSPTQGKHGFLHLGYEFLRGAEDGLTYLHPEQVIVALEDLGIGAALPAAAS